MGPRYWVINVRGGEQFGNEVESHSGQKQDFQQQKKNNQIKTQNTIFKKIFSNG